MCMPYMRSDPFMQACVWDSSFITEASNKCLHLTNPHAVSSVSFFLLISLSLSSAPSISLSASCLISVLCFSNDQLTSNQWDIYTHCHTNRHEKVQVVIMRLEIEQGQGISEALENNDSRLTACVHALIFACVTSTLKCSVHSRTCS